MLSKQAEKPSSGRMFLIWVKTINTRYIYIYILYIGCYSYVVYIYIYIYREREREREVFVVQRLLSEDLDTVTQIQILHEAVNISHSAYTLRKGMNPIILPQAMGR